MRTKTRTPTRTGIILEATVTTLNVVQGTKLFDTFPPYNFTGERILVFRNSFAVKYDEVHIYHKGVLIFSVLHPFHF